MPTMSFAAQPTDTEEGQLFDPVIMVTISDNANDSLTITSDGPCGLTPMTVTANNGVALFPGLLAGAVGNGCRLRVHNNSRPQVQDIVSDPFDVTPTIPVVKDIVIVNSGLAFGGQPGDGVVNYLVNQNNGQRFNSTGANLVVYVMGENHGSTNIIRDGVNDAFVIVRSMLSR